MKTKLLQMLYLGLTFLGLLSACGGGGGGGGDSNTPGGSGTIQIGEITYDAAEGTVVNIRVARSGGSSGSVSVDFATADGTAVGGSDYNSVSGTLTWPDNGSGNRTISIAITDDDTAENLESFTLTLSNVSAATLGPNSVATINIIDNDTAAVSALGAITGVNSVTVNGVRYDTTATNVNMNGRTASVSELKLGQVVTLEGDVNFSDATGRADSIGYSASVIGPVENIDASLGRLIVMGQTILTDAETVFEQSIDSDTFAGLALGSNVQISGFRNDADEIVATRIEPDTTGNGVQLIGAVTGLDLANMMFSVHRLTVDYSNAALINLPAGMPSDGLLVIVRGSLNNGVLIVSEIADALGLATTPGLRAHIGGMVTRYMSASDFYLNGLQIMVNASTQFVNGVVGDLQVNADITVDGAFGSGGAGVVASRVTFGQPVSHRTTGTFDLDGFTNLRILGLSKVTVVRAPDFSVEVTANSAFANDIQVTQDGDTVTIGGGNVPMLNAFVTMPLLNRIDVGTGSIANVTLRNFDQTQMTVNVGGVSSLRAEDLSIDNLTATVSGVSSADFGGSRPVGIANVDIDGVSRVTLNLAIGSTVSGSVRTGQGTGVSTLYYFGTNVSVNVSTDSLSRVVQLGETRG